MEAGATAQGKSRAPVVTHQVHGLELKRIHDARDVSDQVRDCVCLDPFRLCGFTEPPQIGSDHPVSGRRESVNLVAPDRVRVRKAMEQKDRIAVAFVQDGKFQIPDLQVLNAHGLPPLSLTLTRRS